MMIFTNLGATVALTYLLLVPSVYAGDGNIVTLCPIERAAALKYEHTLIELVTAQLAPYNETFNSIDLRNDTETELLTEKTRDVVCSTSNANDVSYLVGNVTACPQLADDSVVTGTWIVSLVVENLDLLTTGQHVCEFFEGAVCSFREIQFNRCFLTISGEFVTENQEVNVCAPNKTDELTCMIETYKECEAYFNLTSNEVIAPNVKNLITSNQWNTFINGSELCDCYDGAECFSTLQEEITPLVSPATPLEDLYQNTVYLSELLCSNVTTVKCAMKAQPQTCRNVLDNHNDSQTKLSVYNATVHSICGILETTDFQQDKQCIILKLTDVYHPCLMKANLPSTIKSCGYLKTVYNCVTDSLKGQCNGDYIGTAYDMIRTLFNSTLTCDVTSSADIFSKPTIILYVAFVLLILLSSA